MINRTLLGIGSEDAPSKLGKTFGHTNSDLVSKLIRR